MEKGKVKNALRYLSSDHTGGILRMEDSVPVTNRNGDVIECSVQDILVEKYQNGKPASPSALLSFTYPLQGRRHRGGKGGDRPSNIYFRGATPPQK